MGLFELASLLVTLAALASFVNYKFLRLPPTIGVMLLSLAGAMIVTVLGAGGHPFRGQLAAVVGQIDFKETVLHGMLALLLFAGSLHLDLGDLGREWDAITVLSLVGTAASTVIVAGLVWGLFALVGSPMPFVYCLLFGALISPTDPIAVPGIMKRVGAPKALETQLTGESLFNDGIAVVLFLATLGVATGRSSPSLPALGLLLVRQVAGGVAVGFIAGVFVYRLLKRVDDYQVEVPLTLALATGGFTVAEALHVSAPIAVVVAGLCIGNRGRSFAISPITEKHLDSFWELVDGILNAVLFLLLGLEFLVLPFGPRYFLAGSAAVLITLLARAVSVGGAVGAVRLWRRLDRGTGRVLTWGGLRGGLSVAMALALPDGPERNLILAMTYAVVVVSVFGQGLTIGPLIRRLLPQAQRARHTQDPPLIAAPAE